MSDPSPREIATDFPPVVPTFDERPETYLMRTEGVGIPIRHQVGASDVLAAQLHELLTYCTRRGILVVMCGSQEGFMSIGSQDGVDVSYLSDSIVGLGYFEAEGENRRCLAAVKKKHGGHDKSIHELFITSDDVRRGPAAEAVPQPPDPGHEAGRGVGGRGAWRASLTGGEAGSRRGLDDTPPRTAPRSGC